ncbi:MAG: 50S ribosomal protein L10 [Desulfurococcaceae archaeon]
MSIISIKPRKIPAWKQKLADEIIKLSKEYSTFLVVDLTGIPAKHIQMLRKKLDKKAISKVVKPKVALKAFEKIGLPVKDMEQYMTGQIMLIFTNMNVFEVADIVQNFVTRDYFAPGEITDKEIVIPEGNTGLPAGPILSTFGRLKIPTKVQGNVVYVAKDTVVAKPGDVISPDLAALLQKLGMALKEIKAKVKCGRDGNLMIPGDKLKLNIKEYEDLLALAASDGLKLAVELVIPEPHVLQIVLVKAYKQALTLAVESAFITLETVELVLWTAQSKALALAAELSKIVPELGLDIKIPVQAATVTAEQPKEEKKEEKKEESKELSEEALAEGFAALFG